MRNTVWLSILAFVFLASGCARRPVIAELSRESVVVAFGDSLTEGVNAGPGESYPARLAEILGCRVVNAGKSGEDSSAALRRLPDVLRAEKADLVILCEGGNDMLRNQADEVIRANLDAMVTMAREAGSDVILVGVPRPGLLLKTPGFYRQVAARHKIPYDSRTLARILSAPSLKSDYIHPNAAGYREMANAIVALIRASARATE